MRKAEEFWRVASEVLDLADGAMDSADAVTTLLVHAGIAAADVICCARLGMSAQGESHLEAIDLLKRAEAPQQHVSSQLEKLLSLKSRASYAHTSVGMQDLRRAVRAAERLLQAAQAV